jgi:hypothetical protein
MMDIRIIAEGPADRDIIKAIVRAITKVEPENIVGILPSDLVDETDRYSGDFSDWYIVLEKISDEDFLARAMATVQGDFILVVHIDTAERGEIGYDVSIPVRSGSMDWNQYAIDLREAVKQKLETLIPPEYRDHVAYAIAIEETEAWIIPLCESVRHDTASHVRPKERLEGIIGSDKKLQRQYVNTAKKALDYQKLGRELVRNLKLCRSKNHSLNAFCLDLEIKS